MPTIDKNVRILSSLPIDVKFQDLEKKIMTYEISPGIFEITQKTLEKVQGKWKPAVLYQWFYFH